MIAAGHLLRAACGSQYDLATAVTAHVVVGPDDAAGVANEDDRLAREFEQQEVAGLRDLRHVARHDPVIAQDALAIALEDRGLDVERLVEGMPRALGLDQRIDPAGHLRSRSAFQSFRISRAALCPGIPDTPPPGWVDDPH